MSQSSGSANQEDSEDPADGYGSSSPRYSHRSVSAPSNIPQVSLPYHVVNNTTSRYDSVASSSFSNLERGATPSSSNSLATVDPLGLNLVYNTVEPKVDLIFVHGLGGSSLRTWSWNRDTDYFWPLWLPSDSDLSNSRVFTFGYSANLRGPSSTSNVLDFAKDLLLKMLTFSGAVEPVPSIGTVSWNSTRCHASGIELTAFSLNSIQLYL